MKVVKYILIVVCFSAFGQKEIAVSNPYNSVSDTIINHQKVAKMSSIEKKAINDFSKTKLVFDTDKRQLETWNGKEWVSSVLDICSPNIQNDCGGLGGVGEFPPVLTSNVNKICSSQNDINSNAISAVLTAAGCDAGAGRHVAWFKEDGLGIGYGSNHTKTITSPGTYFARCITTLGEIKSGRSNYITIAEHQTPTNTPILAFYQPIVAGNYVTLQAVNCSPNNCEWENIGLGQNTVVLPLETTTYRAFCKNQTCRSDVRSVQITVLHPTIAANGSEICFNPNNDSRNSVDLTVINCDGTVTWAHGAAGSQIQVQPNQTTTYKANCKSPDNISIPTNAITIYVTPKPTIAKTTLNRLEHGLAATCLAGNTFLWSTGATTSSIIVPSNVTQEYIAYCKKNGCSSIRTKKNIYAAPLISSNLNTICEGQTVTLFAEGCDGTIDWYSGTGTTVLGTNNPQNFTIRNILNPTVFTYRAKCTVGSDTSPYSNIVSVNVHTGTIPSSPTIGSVPNPALINLGKSVTLTAAGCPRNETFWSSGENLSSISKSPTETTTYFAYCFNGTCPSSITNKLVTVVNVPPPTLTTEAPLVCAGQLAHLSSANCNGSVQWYSIPENNLDAPPTSHGLGNLANISISESKIFYATCTDQGVSSDKSDILVVGFSPNPQISSNPNPAAIWEGETIELFASACRPGDTYLWDNNLAAQNIIINPGTDTYYIAKCINNICQSNGRSFFVRVCPTSLTFVSPENDFKEPIYTQPDPAKVIIATNLIKSKNDGRATEVNYLANNSINLEPGFSVERNAVFTAQIGGCFIRQSEVTIER